MVNRARTNGYSDNVNLSLGVHAFGLLLDGFVIATASDTNFFCHSVLNNCVDEDDEAMEDAEGTEDYYYYGYY